ncbi:MAG: hypothetical protein OXC44_02635 [Proteobacteria bacterium]|nr:hypothetical protein [Pseudomonadota bacterium]
MSAHNLIGIISKPLVLLFITAGITQCGSAEFLSGNEPRREERTEYGNTETEDPPPPAVEEKVPEKPAAEPVEAAAEEPEEVEEKPEPEEVAEEVEVIEETEEVEEADEVEEVVEKPPVVVRAPAPTVIEEKPSEDMRSNSPETVITYVPPAPEPTPPKRVTQTFNIVFDTVEKPVDVLIIIDNSYSMSYEIAQVQNNLMRFMDHISRYTKAKVGILSSFDPGLDDSSAPLSHIQIPTSNPVIKINRRVRSYNGLVLASDYINGQLVDNSGRVLADGKSFFRESSLKVFIMVSDEDSLDYSSRSFVTDLEKNFDLNTVRFFGFVGIPNTAIQRQENFVQIASKDTEKACAQNVRMDGEVYYDLIRNYIAGALFDICKQDWSNYFDFMVRSVVQSVKPQYTLEYSASSISSVFINGQEIASSNYTVEGNTITFNSDVLPQEEKEDTSIEVIYTSDENSP